MTKEEKKDEMKNKISMALKDPILQQGFEIICNENEQIEHLREERNYFQEKCEDIELNYYCDHKGGCKVQELEKANKWHYVKDGDLPKENGLLMSKILNLITKMKGSDCLSLALGQYNFSIQEFSYQRIVGLTDVIAWKEIVLPELPKGE